MSVVLLCNNKAIKLVRICAFINLVLNIANVIILLKSC